MPDASSSLSTTNLLIGLDGAGGPGGTGSLGLALLRTLDERRVGAALGATRHRLVADPGVPAPSGDACVCLALRASHRLEVPAIVEMVAAFVEEHRVEDAAPGVAVAREPSWENAASAERLVAYGARAKAVRLEPADAMNLAPEANVALSGSGAGVVGALAAVALHVGGDDGVFIWLPGLDEAGGPTPYRQLRVLVPALDAALDASGREPAPDDVIDVPARPRAVLLGGRSVLLLGEAVTTTPSTGGFGARPKPVTSWRPVPTEVLERR